MIFSQAAQKRYICRFSYDMRTRLFCRITGKGVKDSMPAPANRKQHSPAAGSATNSQAACQGAHVPGSPAKATTTTSVLATTLAPRYSRAVKIGQNHQAEIPSLQLSDRACAPSSGKLVWAPDKQHSAAVQDFVLAARVSGLYKGGLVHIWDSAKGCCVPAVCCSSVSPNQQTVEVKFASSTSSATVDVEQLRFGSFSDEDLALQQLQLADHNTQAALSKVEQSNVAAIDLNDELLWTWADGQLLERFVFSFSFVSSFFAASYIVHFQVSI